VKLVIVWTFIGAWEKFNFNAKALA